MSTDGRFARSARTREEIVSSLLRLIAAGNVCPTAEQVAADAGISKRAVFRHFNDMEALNEQVWRQQSEHLSQQHKLDEISGPLEQRLSQFTEARCALLQAMAPYRRAVIYQSKHSAVLAKALASVRDKFRHQVHACFITELSLLPEPDAQRLFSGLALLYSFSSFEHLQRHQQLSCEKISELLLWQAKALLTSSFAQAQLPLENII